MRIAEVIGKVSLLQVHPSLVGKRWVLVLPRSLPALAGRAAPIPEDLVVVDELGATPGDLIGVSEGMEAAFAYYPQKVPVDAYNACILDDVRLDDAEVDRLLNPQSEQTTR